MLFLLLAAGSQTTTHLISGSVFELLRDPARRDWLEQDWSRAGLAVEEFLRFVSPVQFTKPRVVRQDVELDGVRLRKGDRVMAMLVAANLDPQGERASRNARSGAAAEPAHVLRHRNPFLPRPSARTDRGDVRASGLFTRWPKLHLAVAPADIRWRRRPGLRSIEKLPVAA